eukprot:Platyproteum_vivax@DN4639_c0_g1_i1.p1
MPRFKMPLSKLSVESLKPRTGAAVKKGIPCTVHAIGSVLSSDGTTKKFWSTKDPGQVEFTYNPGVGEVIQGWDQGVMQMGIGEIARISIPQSMGYGASGFPAWGIPPKADLQFEIEVISQ